ncbi:hypothetical protein Thimo_0800 [Thioflavicoccus mobilis 8321]|uniref:Uncharacterized protein n=1 Tax=Thioflavicoccus mobilis 8321 TaxID=765912 RepID=L0GWG4_9GAMM|nr:hypothetical protein Thimo_0800 [Thioflavicoccus mobilis 8321]
MLSIKEKNQCQMMKLTNYKNRMLARAQLLKSHPKRGGSHLDRFGEN